MSVLVTAPRSAYKARYFLDTEFTSFDACQLISVAIVGEGEGAREFYAERTDFERALCSDFVRETVLPQLGQFPGRAMPLAQLRDELMAWLLAVPLKPAKPMLCYDFSGDLELITALIGRLPRGWKHENVALKLDAGKLAEYVARRGGEHHALHDARANAYAFR